MPKTLNILAVDDVETDRTLIKKVLESLGHSVTAVDSGTKAIEIAKVNRPDVIFLDVVMPDPDGFKTVRTICATPGIDDIPVIMCTSKSRETDREWALDCGAKGYIVKPASPDTVKNAIEAALS